MSLKKFRSERDSGGVLLGLIDELEEFGPGLVEAEGGFIVAASGSDCIQLFEPPRVLWRPIGLS
jgi:hypothetical protein